MQTPQAKPKNPNMTRKRQKACPRNAVARWRGPCGAVVVLTATGQLWQRERKNWRLRAGAWTAKRCEDWAAAAGFQRVGDGENAYAAIGRCGLTYLCKTAAPLKAESGVPVPPAYRDEYEARIERYAARAKAGLPLFAEEGGHARCG